MTVSARSLALQGLGFGLLAVALQGFYPQAEVEQPAQEAQGGGVAVQLAVPSAARPAPRREPDRQPERETWDEFIARISPPIPPLPPLPAPVVHGQALFEQAMEREALRLATELGIVQPAADQQALATQVAQEQATVALERLEREASAALGSPQSDESAVLAYLEGQGAVTAYEQRGEPQAAPPSTPEPAGEPATEGDHENQRRAAIATALLLLN